MLAKTNAAAVHNMDACTIKIEVNFRGLGSGSLLSNSIGIYYHQRMSQNAISSKMVINE